MPKVSVIVPSYNHAVYLSKRLDSILNQTYQDFELILLDDYSTDNSVKILKQYSTNPKVSRIIVNKQNSGSTFKQWVKGLELAEGEYIWIAESDDFCDHVFLEKLLPQFKDGVGVVFCESNHVDNNGNILYKHLNSDLKETYLGTEFIKRQMIFGNAIYNASMAIFEKKLLYDIDQKSFVKMKYCGDWLFWSLLAENTKISKVFYPFNNFRRHDTSVSSNSEKKGLHIFEGIKVLSHNIIHLDEKERQTINYFWTDKINNTNFNLKYYFLLLILLIKKHPEILIMYFKSKIYNFLDHLYVSPLWRRLKRNYKKNIQK